MPAPPSAPPTRVQPGSGLPRRFAVLLLAAATVLSACGLRLETAAPEPLEPDAVEVVRQRTTADAITLGTLARAAGGDPVDGALARVAEVGALHVDALGGPYEWEPPPPPGEPEPTAPGATTSPTPSRGATTEDVVAALEETAASARADAAAVPDPAMARLLASVAVARQLLAEAVRREAELEHEPPTPFEVPDELPTGVAPTALAPLIQSEDALGLAWEVLAARSDAEARAAAAARAAEHRSRAEAWALLTEVAATGLDPRRSAYALPEALLDPAADPATLPGVLSGLERELAASYASLVHGAEAGARSPFVDALVDTARHGWSPPTVPPAFPGMPEQQR